MSTKNLAKLIEMFGGVPLANYTKAGMEGEAHKTWKAAKAELEAIRDAAKVLEKADAGPLAMWEAGDDAAYATAKELLAAIAKETP